MSAFQNDCDEPKYEFGRTSGFHLPSEAGYDVAGEWLALTYAREVIVSAVLVAALDPCILGQKINVELIRSGGSAAASPDELYQEVRVLMELGEIDMVWRLECSLGDVRTTVQSSDHMDAVEDMEMHGDLLERRIEPRLSPSDPCVILSMREAMAQSKAVSELVGQAMERSEAYADAMDRSRISMTWAGLADAVGLAEAISSKDDPFTNEYKNEGAKLAESLRPNSSSSWHVRRDAYCDAWEKARSGRRRRMAAALDC